MARAGLFLPIGTCDGNLVLCFRTLAALSQMVCDCALRTLRIKRQPRAAVPQRSLPLRYLRRRARRCGDLVPLLEDGGQVVSTLGKGPQSIAPLALEVRVPPQDSMAILLHRTVEGTPINQSKTVPSDSDRGS